MFTAWMYLTIYILILIGFICFVGQLLVHLYMPCFPVFLSNKDGCDVDDDMLRDVLFSLY